AAPRVDEAAPRVDEAAPIAHPPEEIADDEVEDLLEPPALPSDFGNFPPDYYVLAPSSHAPHGWRYTGARIAARHSDPIWSELPMELPQPGPVLAVAIGDAISCLWRNGDHW